MEIKEQCQGLKAPILFWQTDDATLAMDVGGCGPGKWGDRLVSDTVYGVSIYPACAIHDWMYAQGTTLKDKETADIWFLLNMLTLITRDWKSWSLLVLRGWRIMSYFLAVYIVGGKSYKKAIAKFSESTLT